MGHSSCDLEQAVCMQQQQGRERGMAVDFLRIEKHDGIIL